MYHAQSCHRHFTQQSSSSMGAKRAGGMEQVMIITVAFAQKEGITIFVPSKSSVAFNLQAVLTEKRPEADSMRARSDSLVSDLSSIAKV